MSPSSKYQHPTTLGYMPLKSSYGFLTPQATTRDAAHELGHGKFNLRHTFSQHNVVYLPEGSTQNLMDYPSTGSGQATGTELLKYQWDFIHNPEGGWFVYEDEGEGAMQFNFKRYTLIENGSINKNHPQFNNYAFRAFYNSPQGLSFFNNFTNGGVVKEYCNLYLYPAGKTTAFIKLLSDDKMISISNISKEQIDKNCFKLALGITFSGSLCTEKLGHEAFIHMEGFIEFIKINFNNLQLLSKQEIVDKLIVVSKISHVILTDGGDKDHALFIKGEKYTMTAYLKYIISKEISERGTRYELDALFGQLEEYIVHSFSSLDKYIGLKKYFGKKERIKYYTKKNLLENYSEFFDENFWERYNMIDNL